jgi:hypothetical protein
MELFIPGNLDVAVLGQLSGLSFPSTVTFGEPYIFAAGSTTQDQYPLPLSSLTVTFPAATSPFKVDSCSAITQPAATVTDVASPFASDFGDYSDGFNGSTGTAGPVSIPSSKTVVTDDCPKLSAYGGSAKGISTGKPALGYTLRSTQPFSTFTTALPGGFRFSKFTAKDVKVSGTTGTGSSSAAVTIESLSASGGKLSITLSGPTKKVSVKLAGGITESKSARKDKTVTLRLSVVGGSISLKIKV